MDRGKQILLSEQFVKLLRFTEREGIEDLIRYMQEETDFFTAPASTKYHGAFEGGLLQHSMNVLDCLDDEPIKSGYDYKSTIIVALLHDLCKANCYGKETKNVKENGSWVQKEVTAWAQGAVTNMSKRYFGNNTEGQKKMQEYFNLLLSTPSGVDINSLVEQLGIEEQKYFEGAYNALDEINTQFGLDFRKEWSRLNKEIGDSGARGGEEFYTKLTEVLQNADTTNADLILPKVEDFKKLGENSEKAYVSAITGWLENSNFDMTIGTNLDTTEADNWLTEYKKELGGLTISPSVYAQQPSSYSALRNPLPYGDNEIAIKLYFEDKEIGTVGQTNLFEGTNREKLYNIPITVNNGKGQ